MSSLRWTRELAARVVAGKVEGMQASRREEIARPLCGLVSGEVGQTERSLIVGHRIQFVRASTLRTGDGGASAPADADLRMGLHLFHVHLACLAVCIPSARFCTEP